MTLRREHTDTPTFVAIQNRENPRVIPYSVMSASGKWAGTDISTPTPAFTMRSRGTSNLMVLEKSIFSFLGYPLIAICLAGTFPLMGISLPTDMVWTTPMVMPFSPSDLAPQYQLLCPSKTGLGQFWQTRKKIGHISSSSGQWII